MTQAEQSLADDKMRAEINKMAAEINKMTVEIAKMTVETRQITVSTFLAPFLAAAGVMGATAAVVKLILG